MLSLNSCVSVGGVAFRVTTSISFPPDVLDRLDRARGLESRSSWVVRHLELALPTGPAPVAPIRGQSRIAVTQNGATVIEAEHTRACPNCAEDLEQTEGGWTCPTCGPIE